MTLPSEERPGRNLPPLPPTAAAADVPHDQLAEQPSPRDDASPRSGNAPLPPGDASLTAGGTPLPGETPPPSSSAVEPAGTTPGKTPSPDDHSNGVRQPFTRIRAAWLGVWTGLVVVVLLIVFIGQNTAPIDIHFFWLDGRIPTALALLIAGVGGAIIALAIGAARIVQLRRMMRRQTH
jgi:uncharacterized integral membrane protein